MNNLVVIKYGDTYGDGDNITHEEAFYCSIPLKEVKEAFKNGCKILGFDLNCLEKQSYRLTEEQASSLKTNNAKADWIANDRIYLEIPFLYMDIAKIGNKDLNYELFSTSSFTIELCLYD